MAGQRTRYPRMTRGQREGLLRALLLGRGLERLLAGTIHGRSRPAADAVLPAIAAASGLAPTDALITAHDLLAAHLGRGAEPGAIAGARLRRRPRGDPGGEAPIAAVAPHATAAVAAGVALAVGRNPDGAERAAVALLEGRLAKDSDYAGALGLARELGLPLVVVLLAPPGFPGESHGAETLARSEVVERDDFEAVRAAVAAAVVLARSEGPALIVCRDLKGSGGADEESRRVHSLWQRLHPEGVADPLVDYERRCLLSGFTREQLNALRHGVATELLGAVGEVLPGGRPQKSFERAPAVAKSAHLKALLAAARSDGR